MSAENILQKLLILSGTALVNPRGSSGGVSVSVYRFHSASYQ